jgi:hypothetical protein
MQRGFASGARFAQFANKLDLLRQLSPFWDHSAVIFPPDSQPEVEKTPNFMPLPGLSLSLRRNSGNDEACAA